MDRLDIDPVDLEPIDSPTALSWAAEWSEQTDRAHPRTSLQAKIRRILDADDRIAYVVRRGEHLYNFWRDETNPRGLWRRTSLESFRAPETDWDTIIDLDVLAAEEDEDWVWKGVHMLVPDYDRALIRLSRGGADATVIREFDIPTESFVEGFELPEAKHDVSWIDRDTLLVGTDTGEGSLTSSGYPAQVRRWHRGQKLLDAEILASGSLDDVAVGGWCDTHTGRVVIGRALDFYSSRTTVTTPSGLQTLELPEDCEVLISRDWLFILPRTAFADVPAGGLGVIDLEDFLAGARSFRTIFTPSPSTSLESLALTENFLVMTVLDNVATQLLVRPLAQMAAPSTPLRLPEKMTARVVATSSHDGDEIWINGSSFTLPATLFRADLSESFEAEEIVTTPPRFRAAGIETRQHFAISADGTRIPYFITGDFTRGKRPTLVGGYGGFEISLTPGYSPVQGLAWLQRGGFVVTPNLRGGGEFGPEWHSQVTGVQRHKVWEDHEAVLRDVVTRGYTTPTQIGIRGGSNGGLLTAGALNRYPDAFGAAVVQVPLTDMLRYHTLSAGASWMAEYGDPDDPVERKAIESWSPLHNVADASEVTYPPALVTTSTRDDRVHPAHARLFAHALAKAGHDVDYYENIVGGHAGASNNEQVAHMESLIFTWLSEKVGG
ncbi:S9 family peptidase [Corynebacterium yudongzhengii]|uniref:S9 family peptidase n=1 Tax=Corynebacterium yudongzhengii TaxID=2080740 RepID=A0A2U1T4S2_9CORY|nr:prolyl oligopeptidase family serine peptidase [Corynebacterium yudongzhengii]AWB81124.1 S9 family peptidase [Corynebacterium yudongzhengii]PWC00982.1 S9 family peptidase [Corynebacterium yudongzhengii]